MPPLLARLKPLLSDPELWPLLAQYLQGLRADSLTQLWPLVGQPEALEFKGRVEVLDHLLALPELARQEEEEALSEREREAAEKAASAVDDGF